MILNENIGAIIVIGDKSVTNGKLHKKSPALSRALISI
jgi:hypothetical protein